MRKLVFTNANGDSITFDNTLYGATRVEGLGIPYVNIQEQKSPFQDGSVLIDQLYLPREISVEGIICVGQDNSERYARRREMVSILNAKLGKGTLVYTNDEGSWSIPALPEGPEFANKNANDGSQKFLILFYCPDPYWTDVNDTSLTVYSNSDESLIDIDSDAPIPIHIEVTGSCRSPKITELHSGKFLRYDYDLDNTLVLDTSFGNKSALLRSDHDFKLLSFIVSDLSNVAYSNYLGQFLSVLDYTVATSVDGDTWTPRFPATDEYMADSLTIFAEKRKLWVVVGRTSREVWYSSDGKSWTSATTISTGAVIDDLCYSSKLDMFLISLRNGDVITSTNLTSWTTTTVSSSCSFYGATYSETLALFVIGGNNATGAAIYTSPDGTTWTSRTVPSGTSEGIYAIKPAYFISMVIAIGTNGKIWTSSDGTTWTLQTSGVSVDLRAICVSESDALVCVYGYDLITAGYIITSVNGTSWTTRSSTISGSGKRMCVAEDKSLWLLDYVAYSNDGITWYNRTDVKGYYNGLAYAAAYDSYNKKYVVAAQGATVGGIYYSDDNKIWTNSSSFPNVSSLEIKFLEDLNVLVAFYSNTRLYYSKDGGVTWTLCLTMPASSTSCQIAYSTKIRRAICVGAGTSNPRLYYSDDGINWVDVGFTTTNVVGIAYIPFKNKFVMIGADRHVYTSSDGLAWTDVSGYVTAMYSCNLIAYSEFDNRLCASNGTNIYYSNDFGVTWTLAHTSASVVCLTYIREMEKWYAIGRNGEYYMSSDGITWSTISTNLYPLNFVAMLYDDINERPVVYCDYGITLDATPLEYTNVIQYLDKDSEFFSLNYGKNIIRVETDGGQCSAVVTYKKRFAGV